MTDMTIQKTRTTRETHIECTLSFFGKEASHLDTGIPFLDHMLEAFAKHSGIYLNLTAQGDLQVDDHHTVEDCAIVLGECILECLGDKKGLARFGDAYAPLDEALCRAVVDLSGRPFADIHLHLKREKIGTLSCENCTHFFQTLAYASKSCIHIDVLKGSNDHHQVEAAFKAFARAFKQAIQKNSNVILSTKGVL